MKIKLQTGTLSVPYNKLLLELVDFGSRINKKRGFLFVSNVLGKHVPTKPSLMKSTYEKLANKIPTSNKKTLFIGFAETATALGQGVFDAANLPDSIYIHSTRYQTSEDVFLSFQEEHCHAPSHIFYYPKSEDMKTALQDIERVILVDDEVSTGNTANNLVLELKKVLPNVNEVKLLTILNWSQNDYDTFDYLSLYKGTFEFEYTNKEIKDEAKSICSEPIDLDLTIPHNFGRYGFNKIMQLSDYVKNSFSLNDLKNKKVLVLGTSEFMYAPYKLAEYFEKNGIDSYFQATTRSPVNVDGAILSKISFLDNYGENIDNFLYNVVDKEYDLIVLCYETEKEYTNRDLYNKLSKKYQVQEVYFKGEK